MLIGSLLYTWPFNCHLKEKQNHLILDPSSTHTLGFFFDLKVRKIVGWDSCGLVGSSVVDWEIFSLNYSQYLNTSNRTHSRWGKITGERETSGSMNIVTHIISILKGQNDLMTYETRVHIIKTMSILIR